MLSQWHYKLGGLCIESCRFSAFFASPWASPKLAYLRRGRRGLRGLEGLSLLQQLMKVLRKKSRSILRSPSFKARALLCCYTQSAGYCAKFPVFATVCCISDLDLDSLSGLIVKSKPETKFDYLCVVGLLWLMPDAAVGYSKQNAWNSSFLHIAFSCSKALLFRP